MFKKIIFILILSSVPIFFFQTRLQSNTIIKTLDEKTSIAGNWKIKLGDNIDYSLINFNDSEWDNITMPGSMIEYSLEKINKIYGICWLRKTIYIDKNLSNQNIGLILGRIGNADETYFNGKKIGGMGKFPPAEHSMWNYPRYYNVAKNHINYGDKNVISIRLSYYSYGEILGTLAVTNHTDWMRDKAYHNFIQITMTYIVIGGGLILFLIFFIFFIRRTHDTQYLYYCLQLPPGLVVVFELCNFWPIYGSILIRFKFLALAWIGLNVAHPIFLHRIYDLNRKWTERFLWSYFIISLFIGVVFTTTENMQMHGIILIVLTIGLGFYNFSCHISALYKKRPYSKLFSFFGIIVVLGAIHDGFVYFGKFSGLQLNLFGYNFQDMIFHYTAISIYIGTALVLVFRFINIMNEVEDLNVNLENFLIENALLHQKLGNSNKKSSQISVTPKAEEKMKKVISYINDNYSSIISREGLAASVDVHPDNLGKLFKKYTDKKMGDYIYELRVKEAAKRLIETDDSIIQVAFSVGFESLRTFNRIFPKFMNVTPEKYRKDNKVENVNEKIDEEDI